MRRVTMSKRKVDVLTVEEKLAARRARMLRELVKATLAQLSPDPEFRARADAAFDAAMNERWWQ
jgi:hypothetical protein